MTHESQGTGRGYCGKILHVDLGASTISYQELDEAFYQKYLGGLGLGAKVLWDRITPGADPMGPDNVLGFTTGLLTDTGALFTGRFNVVGKSPLTGGWGDANCGGYFSPALKRCGLDGLFLYGTSPEPVYLYLDDQRAELNNASAFWGVDAIETEKQLEARYGDRAHVACIGPAGERLSFLAGVGNDGGRMAARCGLGGVMGSKKLKAVVAAGTRRVGVADGKRIQALSKAFRKRLEGRENLKRFLGDRLFGFIGWATRKGSIYTRQPADLWRLMLSKYGTAALTAFSAESGDSPVQIWGGVGYKDFPLNRSQKIGAEAVVQYETKKYGCFSCPLRCGASVRISDGPYPIEGMHRPEYETLCAFGSLLLNDDLQTIFRVNDLLNRAGMDTISCGAVVAFAIECFENGILTTKETDGLELRWGYGEAIIKLTEMIINRQGVGDILADGVNLASERIGQGSEAFAVHCGGMEAPMHDPKFDPGFGMAYLCEPTPGRHSVYSYMLLDLERLDRLFKGAKKTPAFMTAKERYRFDNKGEAMAIGTFFRQVVDAIGACTFGTQVGADIPLIQWLNAATGWDLSAEDYLVIGERIEQLRHAFNIREGLNPYRNFRLHPRISGHPPLDKGPAKGVSLDLDGMAKAFYEAMGWDLSTGLPDPARLERLGLSEVNGALNPERSLRRESWDLEPR
jgi:aldehyde:ferredoxin oxidoreductase